MSGRDGREEAGEEIPVVKVDGAVEISIRLGVADAVADVVESGQTLRAANSVLIMRDQISVSPCTVEAKIAIRKATRKKPAQR